MSNDYNEYFILDDDATAVLLDRNGYSTLIDAEDIPLLKQYTWRKDHKTGACVKYWRSGNDIYLHKLVMGASKDQIVDHIFNDADDNRKSKLRFVTTSQNCRNIAITKRKKEDLPPGVYLNKKSGKFIASVSVNGKSQSKSFVSPVDAIMQRQNWETKYYPDRCRPYYKLELEKPMTFIRSDYLFNPFIIKDPDKEN